MHSHYAFITIETKIQCLTDDCEVSAGTNTLSVKRLLTLSRQSSSH